MNGSLATLLPLPPLLALLLVSGSGCSSSANDPATPAGGGSSAGGSGSTGGSGNSNAGNPAAGAELSYAPCPTEDLVGAFRIQLAAAYTGVNGSVRNGTVPADLPEVVSEAGSCRLLTPRNLFCDPPCGASQTCGDDGMCIAYPTSQPVGTVTVSGLNGALTMNPGVTGSYTNPAMPALPHPGFDEGASIELVAEGGDLEPFTLRGEGVAALEASADALVATAGQPLTLSWQAGNSSDAVRVLTKVELNRHGGTPTWVECDAEDTGSFDIPASIVDDLLALEISGWPTVTLTRRSVDSTELSVGCVELQVLSQAVKELEISGVVSCDDDHPCPNQQECQSNLTCPE